MVRHLPAGTRTCWKTWGGSRRFSGRKIKKSMHHWMVGKTSAVAWKRSPRAELFWARFRFNHFSGDFNELFERSSAKIFTVLFVGVRLIGLLDPTSNELVIDHIFSLRARTWQILNHRKICEWQYKLKIKNNCHEWKTKQKKIPHASYHGGTSRRFPQNEHNHGGRDSAKNKKNIRKNFKIQVSFRISN